MITFIDHSPEQEQTRTSPDGALVAVGDTAGTAERAVEEAVRLFGRRPDTVVVADGAEGWRRAAEAARTTADAHEDHDPSAAIIVGVSATHGRAARRARHRIGELLAAAGCPVFVIAGA